MIRNRNVRQQAALRHHILDTADNGGILTERGAFEMSDNMPFQGPLRVSPTALCRRQSEADGQAGPGRGTMWDAVVGVVEPT
jgi:hypothetical protein